MDVLAVPRDVGDAEEIEPGAEEQRQLLDPHEGRGEGVAQHDLGEHQPGKAEAESDDEDVQDPLDDRLGGEHPAQLLRQCARGHGAQALGRFDRASLGIVDRLI